VPRGQRDESLRSYSRLSRPEPLLFLPSSSSIVLTRLSRCLNVFALCMARVQYNFMNVGSEQTFRQIFERISFLIVGVFILLRV
jgi:hypothetical protein